MNTTEIIGIVIVVILIAALVAATVRIATTRRQLRDRYGDEYDHVVTEKGGRAAAEAELRRRERRHATLPLRELSPEQLAAYRALWNEMQTRFVDDPVAAVQGAEKLVARIVADRGYPAVEYRDRLAHLSVDHAGVLSNYRSAHDTTVRNDAGQATTEELRQAMVDYRALVTDLLGGGTASAPGADPVYPAAYGDPAGPVDVAVNGDGTDAALAEDSERVFTPTDRPVTSEVDHHRA